MAAATRTIKTYDKADGFPYVAEPINAAMAASLIDDDAIPGGKVDLAGDVAPADLKVLTGGAYVPFELEVVTTAGPDNFTVAAPCKLRVRGGQILKTVADNGGGGTGTATIKDGSGNTIGVITFSTAADKSVVDLDNIDDAHWEIAEGEIITVTTANGGGAGELSGVVTLVCKPVA